MLGITKIVSGGQTGADRAALDWAIEYEIPHGGWCPKGRLAEDGEIPAKYHLPKFCLKLPSLPKQWHFYDNSRLRTKSQRSG